MESYETLLPTLSFSSNYVDERRQKPKSKMINQYLVIKKLGSGADSKVYLAESTENGNLYAIKSFKAGSAATLSRLEREVRILRKVTHPNIIRMEEILYSKEENMAFIVMEYADSGSLQQLILQDCPISEAELARIFFQVIEGLHFLHSQAYAHQDIKPSNILLFSNGIAKLSDFGIGQSFESAGTVVGSPAFQAPEIFDDEDEIGANEQPVIDPIKEDVWSLGVTLYQAAFRLLPFNGENLYEIIHQIQTSTLLVPKSASEELASLLRSMLSVKPEDRFTLNEVLDHPFFQKASSNLSIRRLPVPDGDRAEATKKIKAIVCDDDCPLIGQLHSWPGGSPDAMSFN